MKVIGPEAVDSALPYPRLVEALRTAFRDGMVQPVRHHHTIERPDEADSVLLLMPAWTDFNRAGTSAGGYIGIKIVTVSPENNSRNLPAVMGQYLLLDGQTGAPLAIIDGQRLTARRTAAASALAASYLARKDASHLLICGAGTLAGELVDAHASQRPIRRVTVWNRSAANGEALAQRLCAAGYDAGFTGDLDRAQQDADIISCCTLSTVPLVKGALVKEGTHVDLVGAFTPAMRESDDDLMRRGAVFVDTRGGALKEGGDIVQALASGALSEDRVAGDVFDLTRGQHAGRADDTRVTVFKSVGAALEDLAAGIAVWESLPAA